MNSDKMVGGFVSVVISGTLTIENCLSAVTMEGDTPYKQGFVNSTRTNSKCIIRNCLYIGSASTQYSDATSRFEFKNNYFLNHPGMTIGTQVTKQQLKNGEIAFWLQQGQENDDLVWGQIAGNDANPDLYSHKDYRVHRGQFIYKDKVFKSIYFNSSVITLGYTVQEVLGDEYNPRHYYQMTTQEKFTFPLRQTTDFECHYEVDDQSYFTIASADDWYQFAEMTKENETCISAVMTNDITLDKPSMIALRGYYKGRFDGNGKTLTVNWHIEDYSAPFYRINQAEITNLTVKGTIRGGYVSGMAVYAEDSFIKNCWADVTLDVFDGNDTRAAGFYVATSNDNYLEDCLSTVKYVGKPTMTFGMQCPGRNNTLTHCLSLVDKVEGAYNYPMIKTISTTNCYTLNESDGYVFATDQDCMEATVVSKEQIENGEVAYLLQAGRKDQVWGQEIGVDEHPVLTSNTDLKLCKVSFIREKSFVRNQTGVFARKYRNVNYELGNPLSWAEITGRSWETMAPTDNYSLKYGNGMDENTVITQDTIVPVIYFDFDEYVINELNDLFKLQNYYSTSYTVNNVTLNCDIDLTGFTNFNISHVRNPFCGTFDGNGHSFKFDVSNTADDIGLFSFIKGATIKNLILSGSESINKWFYTKTYMGALVNLSEGDCTIDNCIVDVKQYRNGRKNVGGFVGYHQKGKLNIHNSLYKGEVDNDGEMFHPFVACIDSATVDFKSCLCWSDMKNVGKYGISATDSKINGKYLCKSTEMDGKADGQGESYTSEDVDNFKLLQSLRSEGGNWAQVVYGSCPEPFMKSREYQKNYLFCGDIQDYYVSNPEEYQGKEFFECHEFEFDEKKPWSSTYMDYFHCDKVSSNRELAKNRYSTAVVPWKWNSNEETDVYYFDNTRVGKKQFIFKRHQGACLPYAPYLVNPNDSDYHFVALDAKVELKPITENTWIYEPFYATLYKYDYLAIQNSPAYILQSDGVWRIADGSDMDVYIDRWRGYISVDPQEINSKEFTMVFEDETNGVDPVVNREGKVKYYNLKGQYVGTTLEGMPAGMYIGNGKKIIKNQ